MEEKVEQFLASLQAERGFSENTIAAYRNDLLQFIPFLADPPAEDHTKAVTDWAALGDEQLSAYMLTLRSRDYAASTVARKTAALKSFCAFLRREGIMKEGVGLKLASPKVSKYTPKGISEEQVRRLLEQPLNELPDRPERLRDQAMLEVLYATGMRVSELVALDTEDVSLDRGDIKCQGKAGRGRVVPLSETAVNAVRAYLDRARPVLLRAHTPSLFVNHRGGRLTRQGFWLILKAYAQRAGIDAITPHTLRHSYAIHALTRGEALADLQRKLGHVNISTTQVYRNLAAGDGAVGFGGRAGVERDGHAMADASPPDVVRLSGSAHEAPV